MQDQRHDRGAARHGVNGAAGCLAVITGALTLTTAVGGATGQRAGTGDRTTDTTAGAIRAATAVK
jgi:hypothetical protein